MSRTAIYDKLIITSVENMAEELQERTGRLILLDNIVDFYQDSVAEQTTLFFTSSLEIVPTFSKSAQYAMTYTNYKEQGTGNRLYVLFNRVTKREYAGYFVGTVGDIINKCKEDNCTCKKEIVNNTSKFKTGEAKLSKGFPNKSFNDESPLIGDSKVVYATDSEEGMYRLFSELAKTIGNDDCDAVSASSQTITETEECSADSLPSEKSDTTELKCSKKMKELAESLINMTVENRFSDLASMVFYLKMVGLRITELLTDESIAEEQTKKLLVLSRAADKVGVKLNLFSKYFTDIYAVYTAAGKNNDGELVYNPIAILSSRNELLRYDFDKDVLQNDLEQLYFVAKEDRYLDATLEEFDLNFMAMNHIISENLERFPEAYRNLPVEQIALKIQSELQFGLKINSVTGDYVRALYGIDNRNKWILPLHLTTRYSERPELVLLVAKRNYYYEVKTILNCTDNVMMKLNLDKPNLIGWGD